MLFIVFETAHISMVTKRSILVVCWGRGVLWCGTKLGRSQVDEGVIHMLVIYPIELWENCKNPWR